MARSDFKGKRHRDRKNDYSRKRAYPPMLVMRQMFNTDLEIKDRMAVQAFTLGAAKKVHYDRLLALTNMLIIGGSTAPERQYAKEHAEKVVIPALYAIKTRFERTGKLGVSAAELKILQGLPEFSKQFWNRCPIDVYHYAGKELRAFYQELAEKDQPEDMDF